MNILLAFLFPFMLNAKADSTAVINKIEAKVAETNKQMNAYFEEWKTAGKKRCEERDYRDWQKKCLEYYDTVKTIHGGPFTSSDGKLNIEWHNMRDCVYNTVYYLNGKIVRITYDYYDATLEFYYNNGKLVMFVDDERVNAPCGGMGNYFARFYFEKNKLRARVISGEIKEIRKQERNGERYQSNVFTDEKAILELAQQLYSAHSKK